jgi:hypothetical protein
VLTFKSGKVVVTDGIEIVPVVDKLYKNDKNGGKKFFNDAILYAYFMYRKGSSFENMFPKKRAVEISKVYFGDINRWENFEKNLAFQEFRDYYVKIQYSSKEQAVHSVLKEIEELILDLQNIHFWVDDVVEKEIDIPLFEGSLETKKLKIKYKIKRDNKDDKLKAISAINTLLKQEETLKASIKSDEKIKRLEDEKSLLDRGELTDD